MKTLLVFIAASIAMLLKSDVDMVFLALAVVVIISAIVLANQLDNERNKDNRSIR